MNGRGQKLVNSGVAKVVLPGAAALGAKQRSTRSIQRQRDREERAKKLAAALAAAPLPPVEDDRVEKIILTPDLANELLDRNKLNRPLSDPHVERIRKQIEEGKWKYNGDTIKISKDNEILDGQHRLWAIWYAAKGVETVIVWGIEKEAFATIDTVRKLRTGADTIALAGQKKYLQQTASTLTWLLRWQRNVIETFKAPENKIENSDIQLAFEAHPTITRAVEAAMRLRMFINPSMLAFAYYVMSNQNNEIADLLLHILRDPGGTSIDHPFYRLRTQFQNDKEIKKDPVRAIALLFKTANLVAQGRECQHLSWRNQGHSPEAFPVLSIAPKPTAKRA